MRMNTPYLTKGPGFPHGRTVFQLVTERTVRRYDFDEDCPVTIDLEATTLEYAIDEACEEHDIDRADLEIAPEAIG